ncbi:MAG: MCE family protein [Betaproteobacteria bacterium]|nr:MCE family protein [Betaproteobacteria bacterium]
MESKVNFAVVGMFVLVLGTLLIGGVLWLSSGKSYRKTYDPYRVYMSESVSGLSLDAPVRYRGVQVGSVRRIELAPGNPEMVRLTLNIEHGTPVKQDTVAVLRVQGLTGIAHLELSGGSRAAPPLQASASEEYPVIRTGPSLMLRLDTAITALLANLNRSSESINALLDEENRNALRNTLVSLERVSAALAARSDEIERGLNQAARAMENTARLTARANAELPQLNQRIQHSADAFDRMANRGAQTMENAGQLLQRIQRSADAFDRMAAEGTRAGSNTANMVESVRAEALPEARQTITELRETTAALRRFAGALERNPGMLLRGRQTIPPGPGE